MRTAPGALWAALLVVLALVGGIPASHGSAAHGASGDVLWLPVVAGDPLPEHEWDPRLDDLNVTYRPATDCSAGCWRLTSAIVKDDDEGGGQHHIFVKAFGMEQLPDVPWSVGAGDPGSLRTKPAPDWADYPMYRGSCYFPDRGESGPHVVTMGGDPAASDAVVGIGLPYCVHFSYFLQWRWEP